MFITGTKACEDMIITRSPGTSARILADYVHVKCYKDDMRCIDWKHIMLVSDRIIDLDCDDICALDEAKKMLANNHGCLHLTVIRKSQ